MHRQSCGTTLIEIIAAIVIFGVLMLSGLSFFSLTNQSQAKANKLNRAIELCNSVMDECKSFPYAGSITTAYPVTDNGQDSAFYVTVEDTPFPPPPNSLPNSKTTNKKIVHVTVTWPDQGASAVDMSSIFSLVRF